MTPDPWTNNAPSYSSIRPKGAYTRKHAKDNREQEMGDGFGSGRVGWSEEDTILFYAEQVISAMRRGIEHKHWVRADIREITGGAMEAQPPACRLPDELWATIKDLMMALANTAGLWLTEERHFADGPNVIRVSFKKVT